MPGPNIRQQIASLQTRANKQNGEDPTHPVFLRTAGFAKMTMRNEAERLGEPTEWEKARERFGEPPVPTQMPHDYEALFCAFFQFWRRVPEEGRSVDLPIFATVSLQQTIAMRMRDSEGKHALLFDPRLLQLATSLAAALAPHFLRSSPAYLLGLPEEEIIKKVQKFPYGLKLLYEIIDHLIAINKCPPS